MTILKSLKESEIVSDFTITEYKKFSDGFYIKLIVRLFDKSILYVKEYNDSEKRNYSYHWQDENGKLITRWDNAPHHKQIKTFPHHKHAGNTLEESYEVTLEDILKTISSKIKLQ